MADAQLKQVQRNYNIHCSTLAKITSRLQDVVGQERIEQIEKGEKEMKAIKSIIRELELQLRADPAQTRLKTTVEKMKSEADKYKIDFEAARQPFRSDGENERQRLLRANQVHDEMKDTTLAIQRDLDETEHIGVGVNSRLLQQREQIQRTQQGLDDTEDSLARSKKILKRMGRRVLTDKCIQYLIILVELGIIALIVWIKWLKK